MPPLRIFIASASEGLAVANSVEKELTAYGCLIAQVWNKGTFKPSLAFIESLEAELAQSDFAVLTLTPDDKVNARGKESQAPRDNIVFELGLFMGRLGRERTFFLRDNTQALKLPSDLSGLAGVHYEVSEAQDNPESLRDACSALARRMIELGSRIKASPEMDFQSKRSRDFSRQIAGTWWGRQRLVRPEANRLAFFRIIPSEQSGTLDISGDTFDEKGTLFAHWSNNAIGVRVEDRTVVFAWEGTHPREPGKTFGGFGQYKFRKLEGGSNICKRGEAMFGDIEKGVNKPAHWTSVDLRRVEDLDRVDAVMVNGSDEERATEIVRVLASFIRPNNADQ